MKDLYSKISIKNSSGNELANILVSQRSKRKLTHMVEDFITLEFSTDIAIRFERGCYCDIRFTDYHLGEHNEKIIDKEIPLRYIVCEPYYPTYNKSTGGYDYSLRMDSWIYSWKRYQFAMVASVGSVETSFGFTDRFEGHIRLLLELLNMKSGADRSIVFPDTIAIHYIQYDDTEESSSASIWTTYLDGRTGAVVSTEQEGSIGLYSNESAKHVEYRVLYINYNNRNIIEALGDLCGEGGFNCEWWVEENANGRILHFGRCEHGSNIKMERNKEIADITRQQSSDEFATRLIAFGSTRNAPARYREILKCEIDEIFSANDLGLNTSSTNLINYKPLKDADIVFANEGSSEGTGYTFIKRLDINDDYIQIEDVRWFLTTLGGGGMIDPALYEISCFVCYEVENCILSNFSCVLMRTEYNEDGEKIDDYIISERVENLKPNTIVKLTTEPWDALLENREEYSISISAQTEYDEDIKKKITFHVFGCLEKRTSTLKPTPIEYVYFRDSTRPLKPSHFNYSSLQYSPKYRHNISIHKSNCFGNEFIYDTNFDSKYVGLMVAGKLGIYADFTGNFNSVEVYVIACTEYGNLNSSIGETYIGTFFKGEEQEEEKEVLFLPSQLGKLEDEFFLYVKLKPNGGGKGVLDGTLEIRSKNPSVSVTVNMVDEKNAVESSFVAKLNSAYLYEGSSGVNSKDDGAQSASLFRYEKDPFVNGQQKVEIIKKKKYIPQGIDEAEINESWFTPLFDGYRFTASSEKRLMLPTSSCPYNYIDKNTQGGTNIVELVKVFEDIYPSMNVRIVKVGTYQETIKGDEGDRVVPRYFFCLRKSDVNFSERYLVPGKNLQCQFLPKVATAVGDDVEEKGTVGTLAGFTFDLKFVGTYEDDNTLQRYNIISDKSYGVEMPNEYLAPAEGDKIVLLNYQSNRISALNLVEKAEQRLYKAASAYLDRISVDRGTYTATLYAKYAKTLFDSLEGFPTLGQQIAVTDKTYFDSPRNTRVIGIEHKLDIPYDNPVFTLGEAEAYSRFKSIESKIK